MAKAVPARADDAHDGDRLAVDPALEIAPRVGPRRLGTVDDVEPAAAADALHEPALGSGRRARARLGMDDAEPVEGGEEGDGVLGACNGRGRVADEAEALAEARDEARVAFEARAEHEADRRARRVGASSSSAARSGFAMKPVCTRAGRQRTASAARSVSRSPKQSTTSGRKPARRAEAASARAEKAAMRTASPLNRGQSQTHWALPLAGRGRGWGPTRGEAKIQKAAVPHTGVEATGSFTKLHHPTPKLFRLRQGNATAPGRGPASRQAVSWRASAKA